MNAFPSSQTASPEELLHELTQARQRIQELEQAQAASPTPSVKSPDEQQLRLLARIPELNPNPLLRLNLAGEQVYANPAAQRLRDLLSDTDLLSLQTRLGSLTRRSLRLGQPQQAEVRTSQYFTCRPT
ncbi:hypothetical protein [Hymenobacter sp.]|jgi:hypothetical protein|uniref:hypothetical protein n=1 Tax=Hymenobacter sp. TaxID=1898978 RepID=UPI002EDA2014